MRSVIDIEVRDEKFKEFIRQFDAYQDNLKSQGGLWTKQGTAIKGANAQLKSLASLADELADGVGTANKNQEKFRKSTDQSSRSMAGLARSTMQVSKGILSATTMLLKWSGIAGAIGGLLGAGGLFGLSRLSSNIANQQKTASGLGVTYGAGQAFGPSFGRFLDSPSGLLSKMAEYKSSAKGMGEFAKMGIAGAENKSPDELAIEAMRNAREFYKNTPKNLLQNYSEAYGYSGLFNTEELRRLGTSKDLESRIGRFGSEKKKLNLMGGTTSPYQNFSDQMSFSGAGIEATFGKALVALVPQLTKLSEALRKATDSFMRSDIVKAALNSLATGIGELAGYLNSPQFLNDMDEFLETMQQLGRGLKKIVGAIPGVDMGPSEGLQIRQAERTYRLPKGSLQRLKETAFNGITTQGNFGGWADWMGRAMSGGMSESRIREGIINYVFGRNKLTGASLYPTSAADMGIPGSAGHRWTTEKMRAVDRAVIEIKTVNVTGGNAATSINGMVPQ